MKNKSKSSEYDKLVVEKYKKSIGANELKVLLTRFTTEGFTGRWRQVLASPSTRVIGGGPNYSSVQAVYTLRKDGCLGVSNMAFDENFEKTGVKGKSRARVASVPTCRTVEFPILNFNFSFEGDYWLYWLSPSLRTALVVAPLILNLFNRPFVVSDNIGFYLLTRDIREFWDSHEEHESAFKVLRKYGFTRFWNRPIPTAESFNHNDDNEHIVQMD
jgi:lipocalin